MALDLLVAAFVGILACLWWLRRFHSGLTVEVLPPELRTARLIFAERLFRSVGLLSITAKVDRVYRNAAGELVLLELKTRQAHRAYRSDVIELSAQRVSVMAQTKQPVARHAYVLTELPEGRKTTWHRVQLMDAAAVTALALRREALVAGEADACYARTPGICRTCSFRRECQPSERHPIR